MTIAFQCSCGKRLKAKDDFAGKPVRCPQCGVTVQIPAAEVGGAGASAVAPLPTPTQAREEAAGHEEPGWVVDLEHIADEARPPNDAVDLPWLHAAESDAPTAPAPAPASPPVPTSRAAASPASSSVAPRPTPAPARAATAPPARPSAPPPVAPAPGAERRREPARPAPAHASRASASSMPAPSAAPPPPVHVEARPSPAPAAPAPNSEAPQTGAPASLSSLVVEEPSLGTATRPAATAPATSDDYSPRLLREPWFINLVEMCARFVLTAGAVLTVVVPAFLLLGGLVALVRAGDPRALFQFKFGPVPLAYTLLGLFLGTGVIALLWAAPMLILLDISRRVRVLSRRLDTLPNKPQ